MPLRRGSWTTELNILLALLQSRLEAELLCESISSSMPAANAVPLLRCRGADIVDGAGNVVRLKGVNW